MARRLVVLDRDGTIIVEREYLADPRGVELLPGAVAGLRHMRSLGLGLVVVTNQSGVGRGYFDEAQLERINARMLDLLAAEGVHLDGLYYCPHTPEDRCSCRKPQPGLLLRVAEELGFDPQTGFVVGDKVVDIELGRWWVRRLSSCARGMVPRSRLRDRSQRIMWWTTWGPRHTSLGPCLSEGARV